MYLLDTCILLWALEGNIQKLGKPLFDLIADEKNTIFVSVISLWEISIKTSLGKLKVPGDIGSEVEKNNFLWLNVELPHIIELSKLPLIHADPFDRLLIAQARHTDLKFISNDQHIMKYELKCISS